MKRALGNVAYSAWNLFLAKLQWVPSSLKSRLSLRLQGCTYGQRFKTAGVCHFKARLAGSIRIGQGVNLVASWRNNRVGLTNPVLLETVGDGVIEIGDGTGGSAVVISARTKVSVGKRVLLGGNVRIFDHDFHALDVSCRGIKNESEHIGTRPVRIGDDVFIGTNAIILKGVTIGNRAIIAAGAVVTRGVPDDEIWGGNPAKCLRRILRDGIQS